MQFDTSWNIKSILKDIKWCAASLQEAIWSYVYREANFVAVIFATIGQSVEILHIWDSCIPDKAYNTLLFDYRGTGCTRGFSI